MCRKYDAFIERGLNLYFEEFSPLTFLKSFEFYKVAKAIKSRICHRASDPNMARRREKEERNERETVVTYKGGG